MLGDKILLFIVENYTGHENPELCRLAERAWKLLKKRCERIERGVGRISLDIPADAKDCAQMLEDILERIQKGRE